MIGGKGETILKAIWAVEYDGSLLAHGDISQGVYCS